MGSFRPNHYGLAAAQVQMGHRHYIYFQRPGISPLTLRNSPETETFGHFGSVPTAAVSRRGKNNHLFDHLVRECEHLWRNVETECLGGKEVDHQIELGRLQYGQIGRFFAGEDAPGVDAN